VTAEQAVAAAAANVSIADIFTDVVEAATEEVAAALPGTKTCLASAAAVSSSCETQLAASGLDDARPVAAVAERVECVEQYE